MSGTKKKKSASPKLLDLTPEVVQHLVKPHKNFDAYAPPMLDLYESNLDQLRIKGFDTAAVQSALQSYAALADAEEAAAQQYQRVKQTRLYYASQVWSAELEIYAHAQVAGRTDPQLKKAIAAFTQFMKQPRRAKKAPIVTPPSGSTT